MLAKITNLCQVNSTEINPNPSKSIWIILNHSKSIEIDLNLFLLQPERYCCRHRRWWPRSSATKHCMCRWAMLPMGARPRAPFFNHWRYFVMRYRALLWEFFLSVHTRTIASDMHHKTYTAKNSCVVIKRTRDMRVEITITNQHATRAIAFPSVLLSHLYQPFSLSHKHVNKY